MSTALLRTTDATTGSGYKNWSGRSTNAYQSYIVRWVKVDEENTLSWSVQPHKKSMYAFALNTSPLTLPTGTAVKLSTNVEIAISAL